LVVKVSGNEVQTVPLLAADDVAQLSGFARLPAVMDYYVFHRQR